MSKLKNLELKEDGTFILKNVRLSYPHLFRAHAFEEDHTPRFSATFLIDKTTHAKEIEALQNSISGMIRSELKIKSLPMEKQCLRDGDETEKEEQQNQFTLSAADPKKRPVVVGADNAAVTEEDGVIYAGCYVHFRGRFWAQNNKYGKRINCNLLGVKFAKDGEEFASGNRPPADEMFEDDEEDALG